jgi:hypothetical protein
MISGYRIHRYRWRQRLGRFDFDDDVDGIIKLPHGERRRICRSELTKFNLLMSNEGTRVYLAFGFGGHRSGG